METKYNKIHFDLAKAKTLYNPDGLDVITNDGRDVRIVCVDKLGPYPIVALTKCSNEAEYINEYTLKGIISWGNGEDNLALKEPIKYRRMTNQELAWWLRDCPDEHREWSTKNADNLIYHIFDYVQHEANEECSEDILIRRNGGEWEEPLVEI